MVRQPRRHCPLIAACITLLLAVPLLTLQAIYLSDITYWNVGLSHGLILVVLVAFVVGGIAGVVVEVYLRGRSQLGLRRFPWLGAIVALALLTFFFAGSFARPFVLRYPEWCRVIQQIEWPAEPSGDYLLVVNGRGNIAEHEFTVATLHWSGDEPAGIAAIYFRPMSFGTWGRVKGFSQIGSLDNLRMRIAKSQLAEDQLDSLAAEIWDVLHQADTGAPIVAPNAVVDPLWEDTSGHDGTILGGILWMAVVLLLLLVVGQVTLARRC